MQVRFGTDGVRGVANTEVTAEVALEIGRAVAQVLGVETVVTGRDTRRSSSMLEAAALAGVASRGAHGCSLGVVPTPAVAHVCASEPDTAGVMVSASHNPFADNGLKVFAPGGHKLTDEQQRSIETCLVEASGGGSGGPGDAGGPDPVPTGRAVGRFDPVPTGRAVGTVTRLQEPLAGYEESLHRAIGHRSLEGISLVLDCANGSNSLVAPRVLRERGVSLEVMADHPDGVNINDGCGSNHPEALAVAVTGRAAALGIAFDGDADRVVAVDDTGRVIDGDQIMAMCAIDLHSRGLLAHDTVVVTVMTNLGFRRAMAADGIAVVETPVGDRHVLAALRSGGFSLGGEQSGHIVFTDHSTTGDGLLSALMVLDLISRTGRSLAELADDAMTRLPQVLVNVELSAPMPDATDRMAVQIRDAEAALGSSGRIVVRPSGTEPMVRVMVEAESHDEARSVAEGLASAVSATAAPGAPL